MAKNIRKAAVPKEADVVRNGIRLFQPKIGAKPATLEIVNKLRDEMPPNLGS